MVVCANSSWVNQINFGFYKGENPTVPEVKISKKLSQAHLWILICILTSLRTESYLHYSPSSPLPNAPCAIGQLGRGWQHSTWRTWKKSFGRGTPTTCSPVAQCFPLVTNFQLTDFQIGKEHSWSLQEYSLGHHLYNLLWTNKNTNSHRLLEIAPVWK